MLIKSIIPKKKKKKNVQTKQMKVKKIKQKKKIGQDLTKRRTKASFMKFQADKDN